MVVEVLDPSTAPLWINIFIWMGVFWQYILIGFVPAFYVAITWLFGFPLLQRWQQEVVIMLYPTKAKFGKITQQYEPYFKSKKGVYWLSNPLQPVEHHAIPAKIQAKMESIKEKYEALVNKEHLRLKEEEETIEKMLQGRDQIKDQKVIERLLAEQKRISKEKHKNKDEKAITKLLKEQTKLEKKVMIVNPINQVHVYTHAVNQAIYRMERRESKVDEILNNDPKPKKMSGHSIWIMQKPRLHFHRHYQLIIDHTGTMYTLVPVKEKQQFSIGFWHSLGIIIQKEVEVEEQTEVNVGGGKGKQLLQTTITTHVVLQQMKEVQDYQNFSATRAFQLLRRRAKIEERFMQWITGSFNPMILVVLLGAVAAVAMIFFFTSGSTPTETMGPPPT